MAGYGTDEGLQAWLVERGYELPVDAPEPAILRQRGSDYIDATYGSRFVGYPTDSDQERAWPRTAASVLGQALLSSIIPAAVVNASYRAAYAEALSPGSLSVVVGTNKQGIKREKVEDAVEREYFSPKDRAASMQGIAPIISDIDGLLARFLVPMVPPPFGIIALGPDIFE